MATTPSPRTGPLRAALALVRRWLAGPYVRSSTAGKPYPGDFTGPLVPEYAPTPDGRPDPGEIVWTWVPYEEDHLQGKDRPVLLVGRDGPWLLGLQLTSKDHDGRPGGNGRRWVDIGSGDWDRQRRPSEVRVDRVLRVDPARVRREGAVLAPSVFRTVSRAVADARH